MNLYHIYRISNNSNTKSKLFNGNKFISLNNFNNNFNPNNTILIADNANEELKSQVSDTNYKKIINTNLGNSNSFMYAIQYAIENFTDNDFIYFVEDDYLHLENSNTILLEGLNKSHYVTLYDHPDKYINNGPNPYVSDGGEITRVILTEHCHWKLTNSTTMTFATSIDILKQDYNIWEKYCKNQSVPNDFSAWTELRNNNRTLISPIPGYSTHTELDFLTPLISWNNE